MVLTAFKQRDNGEKKDIYQDGGCNIWSRKLDGSVNYVVIIEKIENGKVYTIEEISIDNTCLQKEYSINRQYIFGYGIPAY